MSLYCGDNDQWFMPVLAIRDTEIHVNDRICQFRIMEHQPVISFEECNTLNGTDRWVVLEYAELNNSLKSLIIY